VQNAVMALVGLICIIAFLLTAFYGRLPGHL
jgi:hypothetical protein